MDTAVHETEVCIVGGGPAGMVLGLLLARTGVRTLVLERHEDFSREFRGEVLMPRFTSLFRQLGLEAVVEACPHRKLEAVELHYRRLRLARIPLSRISKDVPYALWVPQPVLLGALLESASKFPTFGMWFDASPRRLIQDGGRTCGVVVDRCGRHVEVRARVVVGADGRFSTIKRLGGFELAYEHHGFDVVWFVIPEPPDGPAAFRIDLGPQGAFLALPKHPQLIQCGMIAPPDGLRAWKERGVEALRRHLLEGPPFIHAFARELRDFTPFHPLQATIHLVSKWAKDGLLVIGDAAHTCSPAGAIGVSVAVETAAVAAEVLARAVRSGDVSAAALGEVQCVREPEIRAVHRIQRRFAGAIPAGSPWARRFAALGLFILFPRRLLAPRETSVRRYGARHANEVSIRQGADDRSPPPYGILMRRSWLEFGAVVLTGAVFLVFENILDQKLPFIAVAAVAWIAYLVTRWRVPGQVRAWGFRADTIRASLRANGIFVLVGGVAITAYGITQGRGMPPAGFFYLILVYPVWGLVQQFLLCGLLCGNLVRATGRPLVAVAASAVLFGIAHAPDWPLVGLTAVAGLAWTAIWLRVPNLWIQGIAHGLLGALAYYEVLGRDPWRDLFAGV